MLATIEQLSKTRTSSQGLCGWFIGFITMVVRKPKNQIQNITMGLKTFKILPWISAHLMWRQGGAYFGWGLGCLFWECLLTHNTFLGIRSLWEIFFFSLSISIFKNPYFMDAKFSSLIRFTFKEHYIISRGGGRCQNIEDDKQEVW